MIHSHYSHFERRRAPWRRCGSRFPGVVDQMQRSIGNGLGYTKRSPAAVSLLAASLYLYYLNLLRLYLLFSLYSSLPFLHLFCIDLISAQFNTACPWETASTHPPI